MFNISLPNYDRHPLFRLEVRRILWGQSPDQLRRYSFWVFGILGLFVLMVWFMTLPDSDGGGFITLLMVISVPVNIILDIACFTFTLNSIDAHERRTWWELLWLTQLRVQGIITAKHILAQVRAWRVMIVIVSLRIIVTAFTTGYLLHDWLFNSSGYDSTGDLNIVILVLPVMVVFGGTYILEPLWRMRALTALGLWISARVGNAALSGLTGFGAMIVVWISQSVIMGILLWVTSAIMGRVFIEFMDSMFAIACGVFVMCVITALVIYHYYRILGEMSLNHALHNAFHE